MQFLLNQPSKLRVDQKVQATTKIYPLRYFQLKEIIGSGKEGVVYKAIPFNWGENQNQVALKFQTNVKDDVKELYQKIIDYQKNENQNNSDYQPSNIIRFYDFFYYIEYLVIVMEVGQDDLNKYMEQNKNKLSLQQKQQMCIQISSSISFLHSQNFIHRDIKLENYLMIDKQVKLIDFGLTEQYNYDQKRQTVSPCTLKYKAPELIQENLDYTNAVDIWAMALLFYEILKEEKWLIEKKSIFEIKDIILNHKNDQSFLYEKINQLQILDEWKQTIKFMLSYDPNQRMSAIQVKNCLVDSTISQEELLNQQIPNQVNINNQNQIPLNTILKPVDQIKTFTQELKNPFFINSCQQDKEQIIQELFQLKNLINIIETKLMTILQMDQIMSEQLAQELNQNFFNQDLQTILNKINENNILISKAYQIKKAQEKLDQYQQQLEQFTSQNDDLMDLINKNQELEKQIVYQESLNKKIEELKKKIQENENMFNQNQILQLQNQIQTCEFEILNQEIQIEKNNILSNKLQNLQKVKNKNENKIIFYNNHDQRKYTELFEQNQQQQKEIQEVEQNIKKIRQLEDKIQTNKAKLKLGQKYQIELDSLKKEANDLQIMLIDFEQIKKELDEKKTEVDNLKIQNEVHQQNKQQITLLFNCNTTQY